jgi:D-arabinose 1-dehydrogenase-like Zn-dependent alcohol dehydrogenase
MRFGWAPTRLCSRAIPAQLQKHEGSFDIILDAVSAGHDVTYINLLRLDGNLTLVGAPESLWQ